MPALVALPNTHLFDQVKRFYGTFLYELVERLAATFLAIVPLMPPQLSSGGLSHDASVMG